MPELPEVETIKRDLETKIFNKEITTIEVIKKNVVKEPSLKDFKKEIIGQRIKEIIRKGKLLVFKLTSGKFLIIHLRISGWLLYGKKDEKGRVVFTFSDGKVLNYMDQRLLGELRLRSGYKDLSFVKNLGPEPFDISLKEFTDILRSKKTKIKVLLMDQNIISGVGNIYAQEALFLSKISPTRSACSLKDKEAESLLRNITLVLKEAIKYKGSSVDAYRDTEGKKGGMEERLKVYGREKETCIICKKPLKKISLGGRGTCFCPNCQR